MNSNINQTIVAPATTYGKSSLNVIRLSGQDSLLIASKLAKINPNCLKVRHAKLTKIYFQDGELLDECILIYFKAPNSYTTEDVIEFQCHGGTFIAQSILEECIKLGARLAKPGEFTKRAFLGGRIDLSQAQAIAKLIESSNANAHKMLMRHLNGEMHSFCENLRKNLLTLLAHSEVFIDYADEELPQDLMKNLLNKLDSTLLTLQNLLEQSIQKKSIFEGYKLCIIGKPNVGKSSLLNALLHEDRAIVSDIAGTTRDSIEENFTLEGHLLRLIDTAGIRQSQDIIEAKGIERSLQKAEQSDILIALFDSSRPLEEEDLKIIEILKTHQDSKKIIVLLNKADLKGSFDFQILAPFNPLNLCLKDDNIASSNSLLSHFKSHLISLLNSQENSQMLLLVSQYQFQAIQECIQALYDSKLPLANGELELFSFHINEALKVLASITKPYEYSQMLDVMFNDFCLGK